MRELETETVALWLYAVAAFLFAVGSALSLAVHYAKR